MAILVHGHFKVCSQMRQSSPFVVHNEKCFNLQMCTTVLLSADYWLNELTNGVNFLGENITRNDPVSNRSTHVSYYKLIFTYLDNGAPEGKWHQNMVTFHGSKKKQQHEHVSLWDHSLWYINGDVYAGFESQWESPCLDGLLHAIVSSDSPFSVTPADFLAASMAIDPLTH